MYTSQGVPVYLLDGGWDSKDQKPEMLSGLQRFLQDRFLRGEIRILGSEGGGVRVRILELSSTIGKYSDPIITSQ
jgi:hypothetical protein